MKSDERSEGVHTMGTNNPNNAQPRSTVWGDAPFAERANWVIAIAAGIVVLLGYFHIEVPVLPTWLPLIILVISCFAMAWSWLFRHLAPKHLRAVFWIGSALILAAFIVGKIVPPYVNLFATTDDTVF